MNVINPRQTIQIVNVLRSLGLKTSSKGTKLLNKAIQIAYLSDDEYISMNNIYEILSNQNPNFNTKQIKNTIAYAIKCRNTDTTEVNFENIFGFECDEYFFTNKNLIEEIVRIMKIESVC